METSAIDAKVLNGTHNICSLVIRNRRRGTLRTRGRKDTSRNFNVLRARFSSPIKIPETPAVVPSLGYE
eukprot:scaffold61755_cov45-Attheya_sp.AAC.2